MLLAEKRKRQEVAGKVNHPEYIYRLNGDPREFEAQRRVREQGDGGPAQNFNRDRQPRPPPFAVDEEPSKRSRDPCGDPRNARAGGGAGAGAGGPPPPPQQQYAHAPPDQGLRPYAPHAGDANAAYPPYPAGLRGAAPSSGPGVYYTPTLPPLAAPTAPLPGPLPSVYRPKPPLIFHPSGAAPPSGGEPSDYYYPTPQQQQQPPWFFAPHAGVAAPTIELSPVRPASRAGGDQPRPLTSPSLPAVSFGGDDGGARARRRQSAGATPSPPSAHGPLGGGGGDFIFGNGGGGGGLSEQDEKLRDKLAARRRAQELQEDNARQMAEREHRKAAEKAREAAEAAQEEARLRREREERAQRERAEVEREEREKQLKMMGPKAAQALLAQQEADRNQKEAEALAKKQARQGHPNNTNTSSGEAAGPPPAAAAGATPAPAAPAVPSGPPLTSWLASSASPQPPPSFQPQRRTQSASFHLAPLPTQPYLYPVAGTGAPPTLAVDPPTSTFLSRAAPPVLPYPLTTTAPQTAAAASGGLSGANFVHNTYTYETENIKRELREISANQRHLEALLEEGRARGGSHGTGTYLRYGAATPSPTPPPPPPPLSPHLMGAVSGAGGPSGPSGQHSNGLFFDMGGRRDGADRYRSGAAPPLMVNLSGPPLPSYSTERAASGGGGGGGADGRTTPPGHSPFRSPHTLEEGVIWKLTPTKAQQERHGSLGLPSAHPYPPLQPLPTPTAAGDEEEGDVVGRDLTLSTHLIYAGGQRSLSSPHQKPPAASHRTPPATEKSEEDDGEDKRHERSVTVAAARRSPSSSVAPSVLGASADTVAEKKKEDSQLRGAGHDGGEVEGSADRNSPEEL